MRGVLSAGIRVFKGIPYGGPTSGNPNHAGIPEWPAYNTEQRPTLLFGLPSRVENDPRREERLLWQGVLTQ